MLLKTVLITVIIAVSALIQSSLGIGFAMFAEPTISVLLRDPVTTAAVVSIGIAAMNLQHSIETRRHINMKMALPPMLGVTVGKILGIAALMRVDTSAAMTGLGILLIVFAAYFCFFGNRVRIRPTLFKGVIFGLAAGFLGGMFNLTGPMAAIYFYSATEDRFEYNASLNFAFLPSALIGLGMHIAYGNLNAEMLPIGVCALIASFFGVKYGLRILNKIDRGQLSKILYIYMTVMGVVLLVL